MKAARYLDWQKILDKDEFLEEVSSGNLNLQM